MKIKENQNIGELVAQDYRVASVFKKYKIDFCCNGNRSIFDACEKSKMDPLKILSDLDSAIQTNQTTTNFQSLPLDLLADYIEKKHHRYVEEKTLEIKPYLTKICKVHGEHHPELFKIKEEFLESAGALAAHMKKEELIIFPFIRKMITSKNNNQFIEKPGFGTVQNPITMMMNDHEVEGERFVKIAELTNDYTPPEDACATYKVTLALLKEFEDDLHLHIHLENNILFPKAIEMEKELS
jgi:regulator of cell morphogenesis and NO signaling